MGPASETVIKAGADETGGCFFLSESVIEPVTSGCTTCSSSFSNSSEEPVRFLNLNTPAGWENYMRDLAEAATSGPLTPQVIGRIASRYDFHVVAD